MATKQILEERIKRSERDLKVYNESPYKNKEMDQKTRRDLSQTLQENKKELEDINKKNKWKGSYGA
jgi:hypothetical protein